MSLEEHNQHILQEFAKLGNQTILQEESFQRERAIDSEDIPNRREVSETSDDASMTEIDLEECPYDVDDNIVVNRTTRSGQSNQMTVSRCCAICLESYKVGDTVTWSVNENCHHVYHQSCIAQHLAYSKKENAQLHCPTCRQEFLIVE
jgi:hypothetical protein